MIITRRKALVALAAPALVLPMRRLLRGTYDNVNNFPYYINRPVYNRPARQLAEWFGIRPANAASTTLSWIGPAVSGGDSSTNAAGPSTTTDISHALNLGAPSSTGVVSSAPGQVFVGLNIIGANTPVTIHHPNCKILRSNLIGSGTAAGGYPGVILLGNSSATGLLIEDCNISGGDTTNQQATGINLGGGSGPPAPNMTFRRCTLSQIEKGISGSNHDGNTYTDSWFINFVGGDCDMTHFYCASVAANGNILGPTLVQHNTFDGQNNHFSTTNNSCDKLFGLGAPTDVAGNNQHRERYLHRQRPAACLPPAPTKVLFDMRWNNGSNQSQFGTITAMTVTNNAFYGAARYFSSHLGNIGTPEGPTFTANSGNYIASAWPPVQGVGSLINGTGAV